MNNGCGIGALFPAVSTWRGSQAGLIAERRPSFPKAMGIESPRPAPRALPYTAGLSLPADLDTAYNATTARGASAATARDELDPK